VANLQATAGGTDKIDLSWDVPTSDNGSPITGYKIERSLDGINWSVIVADTGSTSTAYIDTGRTPDTKYYYRVSAINAIGTAAPSNTANATTDKLTSQASPNNADTGKLASTGENITPIISMTILLISAGAAILLKKRPQRIGKRKV
jgi:titin